MAPPRLVLLVVVAGACSLGSEIAAARLLAPYFGSSTFIWANTIAIVLLALSVGNFYGGRLADRRPRERDLRIALLVAAAALGAVPIAAGPFFDLTLGAFDRLETGAVAGSFFGALVLVSLPLLILGTVSPWALRVALTDVADAGRVSGRLYAVSTFGSLSGVFLAALLLIPAFGVQRTFLVFAAALAAVAASGRGLPAWSPAVPVLLLAALALPPNLARGADDPGERVIFEAESEYQQIRVVQDGTRRELELNEGRAVHSVYDSAGVLTGGVWDGYLAAPYTVLEAPPRRMAMLGNAAGTVSRAYGVHFPGVAIDGVEIDAEVTEVGRRFFGLGANPRLRTFDEDARPFLRRAADASYDLIGADAYRQPYVPFYLATREFFQLVRRKLTPRGALVVNVGHVPGEDGLEKALTRTLREVFPHVARIPLLEASTLLVASAGRPPSAARLRAAALPGELRPVADRVAALLAPPLDGGTLLTDDRAPVEWIIDASIIEQAASGGEG